MIGGRVSHAHKLFETTSGLSEVSLVAGIEREGGVARGVHYDVACHGRFLSPPSFLSTLNRFRGSGARRQNRQWQGGREQCGVELAPDVFRRRRRFIDAAFGRARKVAKGDKGYQRENDDGRNSDHRREHLSNRRFRWTGGNGPVKNMNTHRVSPL